MLKPVVTPCSTSSSGTELLEFVLQGMLFMKTFPFCAIHVEHCFDCASHSASSRHNAGTYERRFRKMRDACKGSLPPIFFNSNSTSLLAGKRPRFCSFEVTVLPYLSSSPKLIYSKLLLKDFPVNRRLVSLLSKELLPERIPLRHSRRLNIRVMDRRSRRPLVGVTVEVMKVNVLVRSEDDFGEHSNTVLEHKPVDSSDQKKVSSHYTSPRKTERPSPQVLNKTTFWGRAQVFSWLQSAGISDTVIRYMQANGVDTGERLLQLVNAKSLSKWGVRNRKHIEAVIKGIAALHEPDNSLRDLDYYRTLSEIDERIEVAFDRCKENQTHSHYQPLEVTKGLSNAAGLFRANISEVGSYAVRVSGDLLMSFESGVFRISAESEAATNIIIDLRSKQGFLNVSAVCSQRSIYKFCGHRGILLGFRRLDDGHRTLHFLPFRESYHTDAAQLILSAEISLDVGLYYSEIDGGVLDINNEAAFELFYESEVLLARNHRRSVSRVFRRLQLAIRRRQRRVYTLKEVSALCRIARLVMRSSLLPRARQRAAILKMARNFAEIKLVSFQAIIRGVLLRAKTLSADVGRFGDAVMYIQNRIRSNTNACNQIQRVIRGYQSRRRTRLLKRREKASSFISNTLYRRSRRYIFEATQRNYTGFETYLMRKEEALSKLRHQFELELIKVAERRASASAKKLLVQMNRAKASIERQRLLLEEQSKLAAITLSAIRIQVCMRASLVKKWYVRQKKAILRIQSFLRRRFNRIKEEKVRMEVVLTAGLINTVVEPSATHMKIESTRHIDARDMSLLLLNKVLPSKGLQQCQLGTNGNLSDTNPNEEKVRKVFNEEDIEPIPPLAGGVEDSSDHCRPVTGIDALMSNDNKSIHSTSLSLPASIIRDFYLRRRVKRAPLSKSLSNVENCFDVEPNVVLGCYEYISQAPLQPTYDALHVTTEPDCVSAEEASRTKTNRRILATSRSRRRFNDTDSSDDDST